MAVSASVTAHLQRGLDLLREHYLISVFICCGGAARSWHLLLPSLNTTAAVHNVMAPSMDLPPWGPSLWPVLAVPGQNLPPYLHCASEVGD